DAHPERGEGRQGDTADGEHGRARGPPPSDVAPKPSERLRRVGELAVRGRRLVDGRGPDEGPEVIAHRFRPPVVYTSAVPSPSVPTPYALPSMSSVSLSRAMPSDRYRL